MIKIEEVSSVQREFDEEICCVCQEVTLNKLIRSCGGDSREKLLQSIFLRAKFGETKFINVAQFLSSDTDNGTILPLTWHRQCYDSTTNRTVLQRLEEKYEKRIAGEHVKQGRKRSLSEVAGVPEQVTRSKIHVKDETNCVWCQETYSGEQVCTITTDEILQQAWRASQVTNDVTVKLRIEKLYHSGDLRGRKYHKSCWREYVFHALRNRKDDEMGGSGDAGCIQNCALIEIVSLVDAQTQNGSYISMRDVESTYIRILGGSFANHTPGYDRRWLKQQIMEALPHLQSVRQADKWKPALLYSPVICLEEMMAVSIKARSSEQAEATLFECAKYLRTVASRFIRGKTGGDDELKLSSDASDVPPELLIFVRWLISGPTETMNDTSRAKYVEREALTLTQNLLYAFKSDRQMTNNTSAPFRSHGSRENSQVIGLSLAVHSKTRSKHLIDLLHAMGHGVSYSRVLQIETTIANAIAETVKQFGIYIQPWLKSTFVWFAIDNIDFEEDTTDGKNTTHGGIIAVNQFADENNPLVVPSVKVRIDEMTPKNLKVTDMIRSILPCSKPDRKQIVPFMTNREPYQFQSAGTCHPYYNSRNQWCLATHLTRSNNQDSAIPSLVPYLSATGTTRRRVLTGAQPLYPEPVSEWSTLLTMMSECTQIRRIAVGETYPTVISMDMAIYEKCIQIYDTKPDMRGSYVLRLGELHATMAALRAVGKSIEHSGIDRAWMEAEVYGPATTQQILNCNHYKRTLAAHMYSYLSLIDVMYTQFFNEHPGLLEAMEKTTKQLNTAFAAKDSAGESRRISAVDTFRQASDSMFIFETLSDWIDSKSNGSAMFRSLLNYIRRVEVIYAFVVSTRDADVQLHMKAAEELGKLFFAYDRVKYMRLWPRYLADMRALETEHPGAWYELLRGAVSVTVSDVPLVSIGVDHSCEMMVKKLKVGPGIIGISNNANARARFFLAGPYLSTLSTEFKGQFLCQQQSRENHHGLSRSCVSQHHDAVSKIKNAILDHGNPFASEGFAIYNLITNVYIPDKFVSKILESDEVGEALFKTYIDERVNGDICLWAPLKKNQNLMYRSNDVVKTCKVKNELITLKATMQTQTRLILAAKSSRDVDISETIGTYELNVLPLALFNSDGSVCPCLNKAALLHELTGIAKDTETAEVVANARDARIAIVDGMASLRKFEYTKTVKELCDEFLLSLKRKARTFSKIIVVFDRYNDKSLKNKLRLNRASDSPVRYKIEEDTRIPSMNQFFAHNQTKTDFINHISPQIVDASDAQSELVISNTESDTDSNHEEADSKIIYHVVDESKHHPRTDITVFSEDTDVLVILCSHYVKMELSNQVCIVLRSGTVNIQSIVNTLGSVHARALIGLHCISGCDTVGRFSGIGKSTWFAQFRKTKDAKILDALIHLGEVDTVTPFDETVASITEFICQIYLPASCTENITTMADLRWYSYRRFLGDKELPPTKTALRQHLLRARLQASVWEQADIKQQCLLDPCENGYTLAGDSYQPIPLSEGHHAPDSLLLLIRCKCKGRCGTRRCPCKAADMDCTDMCMCPVDCANDPKCSFDD